MISLRACRRCLHEACLRYKSLTKKLSREQLEATEEHIETLHDALQNKDQLRADSAASQLLITLNSSGKKSFVDHLKEFLFAIIFAVCVAAVVRQSWVELYEIPTGSMRPTFREHDRVLVMKNSFGINIPFHTAHLMFDPNLVKRGETIVFSGDGLDMPEVDTVYFYLFPGKKRYVKRCIGKPGDILYFYGGRIYGVDSTGNPLPELIEDPTFSSIEHIPFLSFEGQRAVAHTRGKTTITFSHFHNPVARLNVDSLGQITPELYKNNQWQQGQNLGSFWGIGNFAMCRIINPEDLPEEAKLHGYESSNAVAFLELRHSPEVVPYIPNSPHTHYTLPSDLSSQFSWIALDEPLLQKLAGALYTSRFQVVREKGYAYPYESSMHTEGGIPLPHVADGVYEFFDGKAYRINGLSYAETVAPSDPLYPKSVACVKRLFNSGIELSEWTDPTRDTAGALLGKRRRAQKVFPRRFAYFRDGALYVMGHELLSKESKEIQNFNALEKNRSVDLHYLPFQDEGAPDTARILQQGLSIPEKHYVALGDNHSVSLDSRLFGFLPEENLQGSTRLVFWPFGPRMGRPPQPEATFWRKENGYVLVVATLFTAASMLYFRRASSYKRYLKLKKTITR